MNCDACSKETMWLEKIGQEFICHKCINKSKLMGKILRTHTNSFQFLLKKLKIKDYKQLMEIDKKQVLQYVNLGKVLNT